MGGVLLLGVLFLMGWKSAEAQTFQICSSFTPQRHRSVTIYVDDEEGDGLLRLCHCSVYSSDLRMYAVSAIAMATSVKGVAVRSLDHQGRNETRHMVTGDRFSGSNMLSVGVSYLKTTRRRTTFAIFMFPRTPNAELIVECRASGQGHLPEDDGKGAGGLPGHGPARGDSSNDGTVQNNTSSDLNVTTLALSITLLLLVAIIALLAYHYYKIRRRYNSIRDQVEPVQIKKIKENKNGSKSTEYTTDNNGYDGPYTEPSYEPIPDAKFSAQITQFPDKNKQFPALPPTPLGGAGPSPLPPIEQGPVPPKRSTRDNNRNSNPRAMPPVPVTSASSIKPPPTFPRVGSYPVQALDCYDTIDPPGMGTDNNTYDILTNP